MDNHHHKYRPAPLRLGLIVRFAASGGAVFLVNIGMVALFAEVIELPIQLGILLAYIGSTTLHFIFNAQVVFSGPTGYHHSTRKQIARYLILLGISYSGTVIGTVILSHVTALSAYMSYLVSVSVMSVAIFVCLRLFVFVWRSPVEGMDVAPRADTHR